MTHVTVTSVQRDKQNAAAALLVAQMSEHRIQHRHEDLLGIVTEVCADDSRGFLLLAESDGQAVGIAYVATILSIEHAGVVGWLEELYVLPEHRQKGIGTALLDAA